VHRVSVALRFLRGPTPVSVPTEHVPTRRAAARARYGTEIQEASAESTTAGAGPRLPL
jgi:acyl-CoA dehydrogenase